jgi:hypothetical protein
MPSPDHRIDARSHQGMSAAVVMAAAEGAADCACLVFCSRDCSLCRNPNGKDLAHPESGFEMLPDRVIPASLRDRKQRHVPAPIQLNWF